MKIIDKFDKERLSTAERFSPRDYFEELIYKGRMITKLTTLGILALVEEPDKHAFPSYQKILENSTLGNWEQVLNRIANSPEIKLVKNNFNIREELTQKEKDSWQAQAVHKLMKAFREVDKNCQLNSEKTNLLEWFDKFVEFRNDTQGHGTPLPASLRSAMPPLEKSLDFISTEFSLFKIPWVVRLLGEDGAIIPLNDSGEEVSEESFFQYTEEKPKPEIFIVPNEPQKIYLLETDDDTMDFYFANGRLENNKFEVRSFLTNSFKKVSKPQEITEAEQKISENESEEKSSGSSFDIDSRLLKPFLPTEPYNFYREMDRFLKEIPISCDQLFYSPDVEKQFLYSDLFLSTDHWLAEYLNTQPQEINVLKFYSKNDLLCDLFPDNIWQAIKNYELEIAFLEKLGLKEISELISKDTFSLNEIGELELNKVEENLETSEFSKCVVTLLQSSCVIYGIEKEYIDMDFFIYWLVKDLSNEDGLILWLEYFSKFSIPTDDEIANETSVSETEVKTAVKKFQRETKEKSPLKSVSSQKTDLTAVNLPENSDYKDSIKVKKWLDVAENRLSMSKDEKKIIKLKYNLENNLPPYILDTKLYIMPAQEISKKSYKITRRLRSFPTFELVNGESKLANKFLGYVGDVYKEEIGDIYLLPRNKLNKNVNKKCRTEFPNGIWDFFLDILMETDFKPENFGFVDQTYVFRDESVYENVKSLEKQVVKDLKNNGFIHYNPHLYDYWDGSRKKDYSFHFPDDMDKFIDDVFPKYSQKIYQKCGVYYPMIPSDIRHSTTVDSKVKLVREALLNINHAASVEKIIRSGKKNEIFGGLILNPEKDEEENGEDSLKKQIFKILLENPEIFIYLQDDLFGLREWEVKNSEEAADVIEKIFQETDQGPLTEEEVWDKTRKECRNITLETTIEILLEEDRFAKVMEEKWGLEDWLT